MNGDFISRLQIEELHGFFFFFFFNYVLKILTQKMCHSFKENFYNLTCT